MKREPDLVALAARVEPRSGSDWRAAVSSAVIMLPQAVVLAALAGLPPEAGVYASVFAVAAAALVGRCPTLLSGPNTAIALMVSAALTPLAAPMGADYVRLALTLSLIAGVFQVLMAALRVGRLLQLLPAFVVHGVTLGVGMVLITTQASSLLGVIEVRGEAAWLSLWRLPAALERANGYALAVAVCTVAGGLAAPRLPGLRRVPPLVVALACGCLCCAAFDLVVGSAAVRLDRIGHMSLHWLPLSLPHFGGDELYLLKHLVICAASIAVVGILQTLIIVQGNEAGSARAAPEPDREVAAQGVGNIVSAFTSGFPGSGSFNRSASHAAAGAHSRYAALGSSVILLVLGFLAAPVMARMPVVALAATLVLIGIDMLRSTWRKHLRGHALLKSIAPLAVAALTLGSGLQTALVFGIALGGCVSLWRRSHAPSPEITPLREPLPLQRYREASVAAVASGDAQAAVTPDASGTARAPALPRAA